MGPQCQWVQWHRCIFVFYAIDSFNLLALTVTLLDQLYVKGLGDFVIES